MRRCISAHSIRDRILGLCVHLARVHVMEVVLGTRTLTAPSADSLRMSLLLWGMAGVGKTTLAATAPGVKLWLNFDPDGLLSLVGRDDVVSLDLSGDGHAVTERLKDENPFQLEQALKNNPQIETVVFDSLTTFSMMATDNAIAKNKSSTVEAPGQHGYTHRNALTLRAFVSVLRLTKRMNRHFIATTHEGSQITDANGTLLYIPPALSKSLMDQIALQVNECWYLNQDEKGIRRICVRPARWCRPMKSRCWDAKSSPEFVWRFDPETNEGSGIAAWFDQWKANGGKRIPLPK